MAAGGGLGIELLIFLISFLLSALDCKSEDKAGVLVFYEDALKIITIVMSSEPLCSQCQVGLLLLCCWHDHTAI